MDKEIAQNYINKLLANERDRMIMALAVNKDKEKAIEVSATFLDEIFKGYGFVMAKKMYNSISFEEIKIAKKIIYY